MIATNEPNTVPSILVPGRVPKPLPAGAELRQIAFVDDARADQEVLLKLPPPMRCYAVLVRRAGGETPRELASNLMLLTIPSGSVEAPQNESLELANFAREWVDESAAIHDPPSLMMTFQGTHILWAPGRAAVIAPAERLGAITNSLIEAAYYETELREIEQAVGDAWPQLQSDSPLAFEFNERSLGERKQLRQRFLQVLMFRGRLARLGPHVNAPHLHPPTLASQVGERIRERTRLSHRHEFLVEQMEVFERIYEMCGQRASDYMLARSGHVLEGIIILLLLAQLALYFFEILTSAGS